MVIALLASLAAADTWNLDAAHTRVGFRVQHMMVSSVEGSFPGVSGTLEMDPGKVSTADVQITVDIASIDTANEQRDEHLRSPDFLDADQFPEMTYTTSKVKVNKDGSFDLIGELTLHGVTKPVTLHATGLSQSVIDPWGNERMGARATGTIDRQAFGVKWNQALEAGGLLVGDEVELSIDVEFTKAK